MSLLILWSNMSSSTAAQTLNSQKAWSSFFIKNNFKKWMLSVPFLFSLGKQTPDSYLMASGVIQFRIFSIISYVSSLYYIPLFIYKTQNWLIIYKTCSGLNSAFIFSGSSHSCHGVKEDLKLLIFLPLLPECRDYKYIQVTPGSVWCWGFNLGFWAI